MPTTRREFLAGGLLVALSPLVPARLDRVLRAGGPIALLAHFDLPEPVRVWSRSGTLQYGGFEWQGVGTLGRITASKQDTKVTVKQITFALRGVPPTSDDFLGVKVRNCEANVWLAAIFNGRVYGEPFLLFSSLLDRLELEVSDSGVATISLTANVGLWQAERATNKAWTDETQKAAWPDDTGLSLIPSFTNKTVRWRQS